jgi:ABC-type branched-subunit amino acid transport system substrate-binding protein
MDVELIEGSVSHEADVVRVATELTADRHCNALLGAVNVPDSIAIAKWAEAHGVLYMTANNDARVYQRRRHVFHIGVPSQITMQASADHLVKERGARSVSVVYANEEFQANAAELCVAAIRLHSTPANGQPISDNPGEDRQLIGRVRAAGPSAVYLLASDVGRVASLARIAHELGGFPPILYARGMVCREFVDAAGDIAEGQEFVDVLLRDSRAPAEEQALRQALDQHDARLIATASHGFGWDGLRLLVAAWHAAGSSAADPIAFLEGLEIYHAATGDLRFTATDHNGRVGHDPTTISHLEGGELRVVSTINRVLE